MRSLFLIPLLVLAACADPAQQAAYQQQIEQADNEECLRLGYQPNTPTYGDCRLRLREMRQRERAINRAPMYHPNFGVTYGYHHRDW
jgi:hypothetical protein